MIPLKLKLSGFLSYREPVELDFRSFDLACISGANGAGKSSLLDAITWALFGQARKRDESVINSHPQVKAAEVVLTFQYENNIYRVQRALPRGKTTQLEFHIMQTGTADDLESASWKPLTERSTRETQARLEQTLRLDYDTFINASFFLQGKADQFTQQRPNDRKRILGSILGLEAWEVYRDQAAEARKNVEGQVRSLDGRMSEVTAELAEEPQRRSRLQELETCLAQLQQVRQVQESALESIRKIAATLAEQRRLVDALSRQVEAADRRLSELVERSQLRRSEQQTLADLQSRAPAIRQAYTDWQTARQVLADWEALASRTRQIEQRRQAPMEIIQLARARLETEQHTLRLQQAEVQAQIDLLPALKLDLSQAQEQAQTAESQLNQRTQLDASLRSAQQQQAEARLENQRLRVEMDEIKQRIDQLSVAEGALCPLCGQPLSPSDRIRLVENLATEGRDKGDRFRLNQNIQKDLEIEIRNMSDELSSLGRWEEQHRAAVRKVDQINHRLEQLTSQQQTWEAQGALRLAEVERWLAEESFEPEARQALASVEAELLAAGYDPEAHAAARHSEASGQAAETELRELERAQATLNALERELAELAVQQQALEAEMKALRAEYSTAAETLAEAEAQAPDLTTAENEFFRLQEEENQARMEVGAARQKVRVLEDLKIRLKSMRAERDELVRLVGRYKTLENAFGKDGVPALLIEQALPLIESRANDILDRLSSGNMSVRFKTQAAYKDKKRDDLRETLDIEISDGSGTRDYEMFSGGEAFRVNFAVRLALSEVLAQRAGARLQTLVIDEGFGSQDLQGRQRLVEAINLVRQDFAKILVITHIDELKDAFPTRIEVEKSVEGSQVRVS
jgi:exonuclease SbcC